MPFCHIKIELKLSSPIQVKESVFFVGSADVLSDKEHNSTSLILTALSLPHFVITPGRGWPTDPIQMSISNIAPQY